ncbi:MAG: (5-formylfuran-3-yl)methyl phosphate synthase [Methylococcaceae bacterium]|nr:(5-formylfuran-3-yl)methyl phosphate synthase [Methylococcaceae bacterium]
MTGMLASVENLDEARLVVELGADIIDLKAPSAGALGALPVETVRAIVAELGERRPFSATIGDLPMQPQRVLEAVEAMAATGVDYVKIGFFPAGDWSGTLDALVPVAERGFRLVAVLFGDRKPDLAQVGELARAGFAGVMLDTLDKRAGSLTQVCELPFLGDFVAETQAQGLLCGLAGSLRQGDIPELLNLHPDYLGFRGALCRQHERTAALDRKAVETIRAMI